MKKVLLSIFAVALSFGAFAQDSSMQNMQQHKMKVKSHDGIMMKNGKVMVIENGAATELTEDKTLSNGTVVSVNGTVKTSDGTTTMLKDGDWVNPDGTITQGKWKMKDKEHKTKMKDKMNPTDTLK